MLPFRGTTIEVRSARIPALPQSAREWQDTTVTRTLGIAIADVTVEESPRSPGQCLRAYRASLLRQPRLAHPFEGARRLRLEGRIGVGVDDRLNRQRGEVGIEELQSLDGIPGLLVVAGPGVGGGE